ncbi:MAG: DUF4190 domain-containing protein [Ktedonobacterales bacterium]
MTNATPEGAGYPPPPPGYPDQPPAYAPPAPQDAPPMGYSGPGYPPPGYGYGPYGAPRYYPGYAGPMAPSTNSLAIASLILAFVFPVAAIILGHVALGQINASRGAQEGRGLAIAGLILGYTFTVLGLLLMCGILLSISARTTGGAFAGAIF